MTLKGEPAAPRVPGKVEMKLPAGQGFDKLQINNDVNAHDNPEFMDCFGEMILSTRKGGGWHTSFEFAMMQEAMKRMDPPPKPVEVYNAFWEAFGDKFTPASGIEWKNIATQIKENRANSYWPPDKPQTKVEYLESKVKRLKKRKKQ